MQYQFECVCGAEISDFTRSGDVETNTSAVCEECGSVYGLTITTLQRNDD